MKAALKFFIMVCLTAGLLNAAGFEKEAVSRSAKVVLSSEKSLVVGANTVELLVTLDDRTIEDASVDVKVFMPAMPGMPAMESTVAASSLGQGRFKAEVNFSMQGTWQIHVLITPKTGKKIRVKTSVNI